MCFIDSGLFIYNRFISLQQPYFEVKFTNEFIKVSCEIKNPNWNKVMITRLASSNADEKIKETVAHYLSKNLPFQWQVYPGDTPENLPELLEKHGFTRIMGRGMAMFIDELEVPKIPEGFKYQKVTSKEMHEVHARALLLIS